MLGRSPPAPCVNAVLLRLCVFMETSLARTGSNPLHVGILLGIPTIVDAGVFRVHDVRVFDMASTKLQVKSAIEVLAQCKGNLARLDWTGLDRTPSKRFPAHSTGCALSIRSGHLLLFWGLQWMYVFIALCFLACDGRAGIVCWTNSFS